MNKISPLLARVNSPVAPIALLGVAIGIGCSSPRTDVDLNGRAAALGCGTPCGPVGWTHIGPTGGVRVTEGTRSPNEKAYFTGVTTDVEGLNGRYRISTFADGIFEWNGAAWVSLMTPTSACPNCSMVTGDSPPVAADGLAVNTFAQRPGDTQFIVAGTAGAPSRPVAASGIWAGSWNPTKSAWEWFQTGATATTVGDVFTIRWSDSQTVHAACSTGYFVSRNGGDFARVLSDEATDLAISPADPNVLYVATVVGLQKVTWSLQNGAWNAASKPIVSASAGRAAVTAALSANHVIVYYLPAATSGDDIQGLWKIDNDVQVPQQSPMPKCDTLGQTGCFPKDSLGGSQSGWNIALAVNPTNSSQVLAAGRDVVVSQNGTDFVAPTGPIHGDFHRLAWDSSGNGLAATDGGYFYSGDGGKSWNADSNTSDMIQLTGFDWSGSEFMTAAWDTATSVSSNGGSTWAETSLGADNDFFDITGSHFVAGKFWVLGNIFNKVQCCGRTTDFGKTFASCDVVSGGCGMGHVVPSLDPAFPKRVFAGSITPTGAVFQSEDDGATWNQFTHLMPVGFYDLAVAPGDVVYAIGGTDLYRATFSSPWTTVTPRGSVALKGSIARVVAFPSTIGRTSQLNSVWLLGVNPAQVLASTDAGSTWSDITGTFPTNGPDPTDLAVDPVRDTLYLGTTSGVWMLLNGGSWSRWDMNLPGPGAGTQEVSRLRTRDDRPNGGTFKVYAGLAGSGIWMRGGTELGR